MGRALALLLAVTTALGLTGCAISEDSAPRDIPPEQLGNFGEVATGDEAVGESRIYLLTPPDADEQQQLRAVPREVAADPEALLTTLLSGPNPDELNAQLGTAIPADLELNSARTVGRVLTVDVSDAFGELSSRALRLALAQIVATAVELDGVERVRLRVDGENQVWPTGDGELTDEPLSIYDYAGFLESSQPAFPSLPSA